LASGGNIRLRAAGPDRELLEERYERFTMAE
jgi:hypothetical protein